MKLFSFCYFYYMKNPKPEIIELFSQYIGNQPDDVCKLPGSGSNRMYFRLRYRDKTYIAAYNSDVKENIAFISMSEHFHEKKIPVPTVFAVSENKMSYLLEDIGDTVLFEVLEKERTGNVIPETCLKYYREALQKLAFMQTEASKDFDFSVCYPRVSFDKQSILWDLNYFKYYYAKLAHATFDEQELEQDFNSLADDLMQAPSDYFMFRDFQARNIMIHNDEVFFIDYQGGRKGALQYDVASLLWQARAQLPLSVKDDLLQVYIDALKQYIDLDEPNFIRYYDEFVLIRVLQTLGAYGYRGLYEQKAHFVLSIPLAVKNLESLLRDKPFIHKYPALFNLLEQLVSKEFQPWKNIQNDDNKLTVRIMSFSYKKGLPRDFTGNGGGHIFDCRAIHNPGRYDEYKKLTGRDLPVIEFLDNTEEMQVFLESVTSIAEQSVKKYIERKFKNLSISFGCTGGQHRSVYSAERLYDYLKGKYDVNLQIEHREQDF